MGIVPFVATHLKGRFVVFLKLLLIGYFRLGQVIFGQVIAPQGQAIGPARLESPARGQKQEERYFENTNNRSLRGVATKGTIPAKKFLHKLVFYIILAAASLVSRDIRKDMKVQKNNLKPYNDFFIKIRQPKTTLGPIRSFTLKENISVQRLARSFATDKKSLLLYIIG